MKSIVQASALLLSTLALSALAQSPVIYPQPQSQTVVVGNNVSMSVGVVTGQLPTVSSGSLRLWLRADAGVVTNSSGQVSQWQDGSPSANDCSQSTAAMQPLLVNSAALNGHAAIRFDGVANNSTGDLLHGMGDVGLSNAFTTFMVYSASAVADPQMVPFSVGVPGGDFGYTRDNFIAQGRMYYSFWGYAYDTGFTIPLNTGRIWTDRFNTNESSMELFDVSATTQTNFTFATSGIQTPGAGYYIGGLDQSVQQTGYPYRFAGDIAEIIVFNGSLSDADRLAVQQYLAQKYFSVGTPGSGPFTYQWQWSGGPLSNATDSSLSLTNVQVSDAGTYRVVVSNGSGSTTSADATLTVGTIPSITSQPQNQTVNVGNTASFTVQASGTGPLSYIWSRNNSVIAQGTDSSLNITNVQLANSGTYSVVVSNIFGTTTSGSATLSVTTPPVIVTQPQNQTAFAGGNATFSVSASASGLPTVNSGTLRLWLKADAGVVTNGTGQVSQWQDSSGAANNCSQLTAAMQPVLVKSTALGGRAALRFDGLVNNSTGDLLTGTNNLGLTNAFTSYLVYSASSIPDPQIVPFSVGVSGGSFGVTRDYFIAQGRMYYSMWGITYDTGFTVPLNSGRIWEYRFSTNRTLLELFDRSASTQTNFSFATSGAQTPGAGFHVGGLDQSVGQTGYPYRFAGDIAEIVVYRGSLTESDRLAVESYLNTKYFGQPAASLTYQWQFNGTNINGATNSALTLSNVQTGNVGSYSVVVCSGASCVTSASATLNIQTNTLLQGLVAYYPFNGNAQDASGSGNNGSANNVVYGLDRNGQPGAAADFSSGNAWVEVSNLNAMAYTPVTYSAWFKLNRYPTVAERRSDGFFEMTLVGRDLSGSFTDGALCLYNPGPRGADNSIAYFTGQADVPGQKQADTNKWTQVVFTLDSSGHAIFYWDGQLLSSNLYTYPQSATIPFRIGASAALTDYRLGWKGMIDDVRIYNRALSSNEVAQLYASEAPAPGVAPSIDTQPVNQTVAQGASASFSVSASGVAPLGYQWRKDGVALSGATTSTLTITNVQGPNIGSYTVVVTNSVGAATSTAATLTIQGVPSSLCQGLVAYYPFSGNAQDASGNNNNGNPTNVVYGLDRNGQAGAAADFSSGNAWVEVPTLNAMSYKPVTYSAWFKLNSYPTAAERRSNDGWSEMTLVGRDLSGKFSQGALCLYTDSGGRSNSIIYFTGSSGTFSGVTPQTNKWIHVAFTINSNNAAAFYFDGQLVASNIFNASQSDTIAFRIGASAALIDYRVGWKGLIDDVRLYNRALSADDVSQLYYSEAPASALVPSIDVPPQSARTVVGSNATFTVSASGAPTLAYQWLLNGAPISGATTNSYTVTNPQLSDNGSSYSVVVTNSYGTATSAPAVLAVGLAPSISTQPVSQTVNQGATAGLSVGADGTSPFGYQWYLNGAAVSGATDSALSLPNVQVSSSGSYSVVVTNMFGTATSSTAVVTVIPLPTVTSQPDSQTVIAGNTAVFSVAVDPVLPAVASGTLQLWLRGDSGVVTNASGQVSQWRDSSGLSNDCAQATAAMQPQLVNSSSLNGRAALRFDGLVNNSTGDLLTGEADLGLTDAFTSYLVYSASSIPDPQIVPFSVGISGGSFGVTRDYFIAQGKMDYSMWGITYNTGFTVPLNTGRLWEYRFDTNRTLIELFDRSATSQTNFTFATSGAQTPGAGYHVGGLDQSVAQTGFPYRFAGDIAEVIVYRGKLAEGERVAVEQYLQQKYLSGPSTYSYQWQFNGVNIDGATNSSLTINNAQTSDGGTYDVIVCNGPACTTSSNATLTVNVPPSITLQPVSQSVIVGNPVTFTANGTGTAPLSYQWRHDGANISGATNTSLSIASAQLADAGSYTFVVSSPYGAATSSVATLQVIASTLIAGNVNGAGSGAVTEPISLVALGNENALGFSLAFDPAVLSLSGVTLGSDAAGGTLFFNTNQATSGRVGIVVSLPTGSTFAPGTQQVAVVNFSAALLATQTVSSISFVDAPTTRQISDTLANSLPASYVNGSATVSATVFEGDVSPRPNGNQNVTITDWVQVGRFAAGLDTVASPSEFQRADCAPRSGLGNGNLTVSDWVQAGRYAVGLDPLTAVGGPTGPGGSPHIAIQPKAPSSRTITLDTVAKNGTTNVVSVDLNALGNENAVGFSLSFDNQLMQFVGASVGSGAPGASMNVNSSQATNGTIGVALAMPIGQSFNAGTQEVVRLNFVPTSYSSGTSNLTFTDAPVFREVSDVTANALSATYVDSSMTIGGLVPPSLTVAVDGSNNVVVTWPAATGFGLESNTSLSTNWTPVTVTPVTNGGNATVTQPISGDQIYFRLRKP